MDPSDAIDDDNYACNIGGSVERESGSHTNGNVKSQSPTISGYCHEMSGNDDNLRTDFQWGGGPNEDPDTDYTREHNEGIDALWGEPSVSGSRNYRIHNECVKSMGQRWSENVFGTSVVTSVERLFDWF